MDARGRGGEMASGRREKVRGGGVCRRGKNGLEVWVARVSEWGGGICSTGDWREGRVTGLQGVWVGPGGVGGGGRTGMMTGTEEGSEEGGGRDEGVWENE